MAADYRETYNGNTLSTIPTLQEGAACPINMKTELLGELEPYIEVKQQTLGPDMSVDIFVADPVTKTWAIEITHPIDGQPSDDLKGNKTETQKAARNDQPARDTGRLDTVRRELATFTMPHFANKLDRMDYEESLKANAKQKTPNRLDKWKENRRPSRKLRMYPV